VAQFFFKNTHNLNKMQH